MQQVQIIAYGLDGRLAALMQETAHAHGLWLREVQHPRTCRNLLYQGGPAVLVMMLGRDLIQELTIIEELGQVSPDTAVIVLGDTDHPALAALAWDLGARCVLQPPQPIELLPEVVLRMLPKEPR
jgi:DNA-binding NarL/FixJ family response regulator